MPKPSKSINTVKKMTSSEPRRGLSTMSGRAGLGGGGRDWAAGRQPFAAIEFTPKRAAACHRGTVRPGRWRPRTADSTRCFPAGRSPYDSTMLHTTFLERRRLESLSLPRDLAEHQRRRLNCAAQSHLAAQPVLCRKTGRPVRFRSPGRSGWAAPLARRDRPSGPSRSRKNCSPTSGLEPWPRT